MKKFLMFILIIFLVGGCSNKEVVDDSMYNLDAKYNVVEASTRLKFMDSSEDAILAFPPAFSFAEMGQPAIPGYIEDNQYHEMDLNTSSTCSLSDASSCEGIIYSNAWPIYYYKGKLYSLIQDERNPQTNAMETYIKRYDLDAKNSKKIMTFNTENVNMFAQSYSPSLQFHRNKVFATMYDSLFIADLDDKEIKKVELEGVDKVVRIILNNETLYVSAEQYNDGENAHFNVILECDLEGNIKRLLYEEKLLHFIDENYLFYTKQENDTVSTWLLDRDTKEEKTIDGNLYTNIFKYNDSYLLDANENKFIVLNANGEIISEKETDTTYLPQLYIGNRYYVCVDQGSKQVTSKEMSGTVDITWFAYYEISDKGISDLNVLDLPEGD